MRYIVMELIRHVYMQRFAVENLFDEFIRQATRFYEKPAHNLQQLRARPNTKARGDLFEAFCAAYLSCVCGYEDVWLLADVPDEILTHLSMKRKDMGIDLVVRDRGSFYAVQCKYKKCTVTPTGVSWRELSTFYALCMRTGPWEKHIVMTNGSFVRHQGTRTQADVSMCLHTFRRVTSVQWASMVQTHDRPDACEPASHPTLDELRNRRLAYFESDARNGNPPSQLAEV
jgi:hypothetical protein